MNNLNTSLIVTMIIVKSYLNVTSHLEGNTIFPLIARDNERSQNTVLLASTQALIYKSPHSTVWECISPGTSAEYGSTVGSLRVARLEHIAHRFGSDKLYICLSNKCFKVYPVYSLCTDVRPSQDHRILRMQTVRINLATIHQDIHR